MKEILHPYFAKGFATLFTRFLPEWIDLAVELAGEVRPLIASDVMAKYPGIGAEENLPACLAEYFETDAGLQAAVLYRISHALFRREPGHAALRHLAHFMAVRTGAEIYYSTEIGPRFIVMHGAGLVLGPRSRIGGDFTVYQGVTIGQRRIYSPHEHVTIGSHCVIFAGAKILGALTIGDHVSVAANAVLLADAEAHSTYAGIPAVKVGGAKSRSPGSP